MDDNNTQTVQSDATNPNAGTTTQLNIPQEIQIYLNTLIEEAKIPTYDEESKQNIMQELFERLDKFLSIKIVENMKDEDADTLLKLNEEQKPQSEIDKFIHDHLPNAKDIFARAFVDFRDFYLSAQSNFQEVQKAGNPL